MCKPSFTPYVCHLVPYLQLCQLSPEPVSPDTKLHRATEVVGQEKVSTVQGEERPNDQIPTCCSLLLPKGLVVFNFTYLFLERGEGREKERERNINQLPLTHPQMGTLPSTQACTLTKNQTSDLPVHSVLYPLSHTSQGTI